MSDRNDLTRPQPEPARAHAGAGAEDLRATAREAREAAAEAAGTVREEVAATTETLKREGTRLLDDARSRAEGLAQDGVRTGAERAGGIARAVHRAADEIEGESPALARTIHEAAGALDGMARRLRGSSPGEMLRGAEEFARRQPLAFFGAAAFAGFALARFARSSSPPPQDGRGGSMRDARQEMRPAAPAAGPDDIAGTGAPIAGAAVPPAAAPHTGDTATPRPATLASASLGGAAARQTPPRDEV